MSVKHLHLIAVAAILGCASASSAPAERRNPNVITRQQIVDSQATTAYDVINRLRPTFLRSRGRTTMSSGASEYAQVYLDGQKYGEIAILHSVPVDHIREIRFLNASDATTRFGIGHANGVIEIISR